jgi:hypothetical protein
MAIMQWLPFYPVMPGDKQEDLSAWRPIEDPLYQESLDTLNAKDNSWMYDQCALQVWYARSRES